MIKRINHLLIIYLFILYTLSYNIFYVFIFQFKFSLCISLVIPSTNTTWFRCKRHIENMICASSKYPKEVIIVISESGVNRKVKYITYCNFIINLYYRKNIKNAASNKNYGSKYTTCSHISFFDSDDIMSNNRIKTIHYILYHYKNFDLIMHMYSLNYSLINNNYIDYKNINSYFYLNSSYISDLYKKNINSHKLQLWGCCHFLPIHYHISNGWITISKKMFEREKFNEDISIQRAEDSEFNGRVISKGYRALILTLILGYYSKNKEKCINIL